MSKVKDPPEWKDGISYEEYKKEIKVWQLLKSASNKEEGPLIFRTLTGRAKAAAHELSVDDIGAEDGLSKILAKLDELYEADKNQRIYVDLEAFEKVQASWCYEYEYFHSRIRETTQPC